MKHLKANKKTKLAKQSVEIRNLLIRLQEAKTSTKKRRLRKRLRALGHRGGSCGKIIEVKKPKRLSAKRKKEITKHNKEVTQRIKSREHKPFS